MLADFPFARSAESWDMPEAGRPQKIIFAEMRENACNKKNGPSFYAGRVSWDR
jgi:hypothetical protein